MSLEDELTYELESRGADFVYFVVVDNRKKSLFNLKIKIRI